MWGWSTETETHRKRENRSMGKKREGGRQEESERLAQVLTMTCRRVVGFPAVEAE